MLNKRERDREDSFEVVEEPDEEVLDTPIELANHVAIALESEETVGAGGHLDYPGSFDAETWVARRALYRARKLSEAEEHRSREREADHEREVNQQHQDLLRTLGGTPRGR